MPSDLHDLFRDAAGESRGAVDAGELWARGRRRRWARVAGGSLGALAAVVVVVVAVGNVLPGPVPTIEPTAPTAPADAPGVGGPDGSAVPDAALMAEPCAEHDARDSAEIPEPFIEVVSPVADQRIDAAVELVGCASVYEGTIQYRLSDKDGTLLLEDFTTATAGGPGTGEFRADIEPPAAGELVLEVYWEDVSDGSERDPVRVPVTVPLER